MLSQEEVRHIAVLARVGLSDAEVKLYQKDLSAVLAWFEELSKADTDRIGSVGHVTGRNDVARSDIVESSSLVTRDGIIANFPEQKDGYLKVKSVF